MFKKYWTDQPDVVTEAEPVLNIFLNGAGVEARKLPDGKRYYITSGNLFGSQTIEVPNGDDVFKFISIVESRKGDSQIKLPPGWKILENCK